MRLIAEAEYRAAPWKNGAGITAEIAAESESNPAWRVSLATIASDAPFSDLGDYDRTIVLIGGICTLVFKNGQRKRLETLEAFSFDGAEAPHCLVESSPARAFNVMTRHGFYRHRVVIGWDKPLTASRDAIVSFLYALEGLHAGDTFVDPLPDDRDVPAGIQVVIRAVAPVRLA